MDKSNPRFSGSNYLLDCALKSAVDLGAETRLIRLNDLKFRACEGYYSKAAQACTWPCSITQMDASDELDRVYDAFVHWADAIIVASPIRWGTASSLYFTMAERMNCVQNQITIANRVLMRNKVAGFIIVGGQDTRCSASSRSSASSFRSSRLSLIRAAGRTRTWRTTSRWCETRRSSPTVHACLRSGCSILRGA